MKYYALNLRAVSPLAIRADHAREGAQATDYIPGAALAGSLAAVYRLYYPDSHDNFEQLFISGQAQYPDLHPAIFKDSGIQNADEFPVYPIPKTAQSCKRFSGFKHIFDGEKEEVKEGDRHGVCDSLIDWATFCLANRIEGAEPAVLLAAFEKYKQCPYQVQDRKCPYPMDHFTGYYRREKLREPGEKSRGPMIIANTDTRLQTHTGINRDTGTVQEGILYNRRVFAEQTCFWGMVKVSDDLAPTFASFINDVGESGLVRVGTGRTRGMGKVAITVTLMEDEQENFISFQQRLSAFNDRFHETMQMFSAAHGLKLDPKPFYFALTLHSPVIMRDNLLRYRGNIDNYALAEILEMQDEHEQFTLLYQSAGTKRVTGWNDLWGTPRTNDFAIETSSVFLFESELPQAELEQALFKLEHEGIGQRRTEGFGRICVSDPFHLEVELR